MLFPRELILLLSWIWAFFKDWWWLIAPPVLLFTLHDLWLFYVRWRRFLSMEWVLLEIRLPQLVERTPKAMEQVFAGLHGLLGSIKPHEKYLHGKVQDWASCEIASTEGDVRFFIRVPAGRRSLVEAHVWAQYPDAEIYEAEDYTQNVPRGIPNAQWDFWGAEFMLQKPDAYPIRTYVEFEEPVEERRLDPMAGILEVMSSLGPGEHFWMQWIVQPTLEDWHAEGEKVIAKLIKKAEPKRPPGFIAGVASDVVTAVTPQFGAAAEKKPEKEPLPSQVLYLSHAEQQVVEAIGRNIAKIGFVTGLRMMYLAKRDVMDKAKIYAMYGAIRQFNTQNLNSIIPNSKTIPNITYFAPKQRNFMRKRRLDWRYRMRLFTRRKFIFNIEELATVYHFPGLRVAKAPAVGRIEAKRGEPPQSLPRA